MSQIKSWVNGNTPIDGAMIAWAENTAKSLVSGPKPLTSSTIRRFFGEMRRIQSNFDQADAVMLKAKLAYDAGRKGGQVTEFYKTLAPAIEEITDKNSFDRFVKIAEALVSFHKLHVEKKFDD